MTTYRLTWTERTPTGSELKTIPWEPKTHGKANTNNALRFLMAAELPPDSTIVSYAMVHQKKNTPVFSGIIRKFEA